MFCPFGFVHTIWCDLTRPLRDLSFVSFRDFKGIILTLLWESNEHLLNVVEVRAAAQRPLRAPGLAAGHMSSATSAS